MGKTRTIALIGWGLALFAAQPAAAGWRAVQAEKMTTPKPEAGAALIRGHFALSMTGGEAYSTVTSRPVDAVGVRVRGYGCRGTPIVRVRVDNRYPLRRYVKPGGWRLFAVKVKMAAGEHEVGVQLTNPKRYKGCARRLRVDWVGLHERVPIGAAASLEDIQGNPGYRAAFLGNFDVLTPENEMKWEFMEPDAGRFDFGAADTLVDFALSHGLQVHGHTLVYDQQLPQWMLQRRRWAPGELENVVRDYVHTVVSHYAGRVQSWDVVNEPLANDGSLKQTFFTQHLGAGYIELALRAAREADPNAKLYINEIGAEELYNPKADGLYNLVKDLRARGVPLDGVGFQFHTGIGPSAPNWYRVRANLQRFADLGVEIAISEMDVRASGSGALSDRLNQQAQIYHQAAAACADLLACVRFTTWGVSDAFSWLGASERALPFDSQFRPKPAWYAIVSALR
jgi:endo-1,4-beta-xylanase